MNKKIFITIFILVLVLRVFLESFLFISIGNIKKNKKEVANVKNEIIAVDINNAEEEIDNSEKIVLLYTGSYWHSTAQKMFETIELLANNKKYSNIKFVKIDFDEQRDVVNKYYITATPTVLILKNGKEVDKIVGYAEKKDVEKMLNEVIKEDKNNN